jgi:hypothetical protein
MDSIIHESTPRVQMLSCDGYVVVSWHHDSRSVIPPYKGSYAYEHHTTLNDAADDYAALEAGEYRDLSPVGIFPCRNGMPFGPAIDPLTLARLMRETAAR